MKILQVINSLNIGGAEKLILDLVPLLQKSGLEVDVLLLNGENTAFKIALEKQLVSVYSLGIKNNIYNPFLIIRLCRYIHKYDLIHVHLFPAQYWVAIAKAISFSKVKLVTTEHSTLNNRRGIAIFKLIDRLVYSCYNRVITISNKATELLATYLKKRSGIATIQNGVHIALYSNAIIYSKMDLVNIKEDNVLVTMVAGFREPKDQDTLIRAFRLLPSQYHLVLVGDGTRKKICEQLANDFGLSNRIHFLGLRDDIPNILKTSDIVVMSSHWEGFGLAALEGMAANKPVIASNVPGLAQVVDGAGILFEVGNANDLADKIQFLTINPDEYKRVVQKCQNRAAEYDIQKMADGYIEIYNEVIKN